MSISVAIPDKFDYDRGYNCFCSPVGVLLKLYSLPYVDMVLYQRWDFFHKKGMHPDFGNLIKRLYRSTQQSVRGNLLQLYGLEMNQRLETNGEQAFDSLKQSLDENQPVMIAVDLHYLPYLPFSERKFHNIHFLIVTGFYQSLDQVSIIDSFAGYQGMLSIDALCKARQSKLYGIPIQNCWFELKVKSNINGSIEERVHDLLVDCRQNLEQWKMGIDSFNSVAAMKHFADDVKLYLKCSRTAEYIRDIEWQRKSFIAFLKEADPFLKGSGREDLSASVQIISEKWKYLRRSFYMERFRNESQNKRMLEERLLELADREVRFISKVINFFPK
ncbi:MAG: BtrH N-terminal domain-containing protein [Desulfobacteraceae bacterium]|jgi:hypothetical protein